MCDHSEYETIHWNCEENGGKTVWIRYPISGTEEDGEIVCDIKKMMEGLLLENLMYIEEKGRSDGNV